MIVVQLDQMCNIVPVHLRIVLYQSRFGQLQRDQLEPKCEFVPLGVNRELRQNII